MQTIPKGYLFGVIGSLLGLLIVLVGSYIAFVLRTIKKGQDDNKNEVHDLTICKDLNNSRLDKVEIKIDHIEKECIKNHG